MGAKENLTTWWIFAFIALLLWYRNIYYDRIIALLLVTLALVQVVEYAIYSGANPQQAGKTLFITLWVQCLILAVGVHLIVRTRAFAGDASTHKLARMAAGLNVFLFGVVFVVAMLYLLLTPHYFGATPQENHIEWTMDGRPLLGSFTWLYAAGVLFPLIILFGYYSWSDPGVAALIITVMLCMLASLAYYNDAAFASVWPYFAVAVAFVGWLAHAFTPSSPCADHERNERADSSPVPTAA